MSFNFQSIVDTAPVAFVIFNPEGVITYWNNAARDLLDLVESDAGLYISAIDPTFQGEAGVINLGLVDAEKLDCYSTILTKPRGGQLNADAVIHRNDGHYVVSYKDTTSRVAYWEATEASALRTEIALNSIPDPIYVIDPNGQWQYANGAALQRFGITLQEISAGITSGKIVSKHPHLKEFFIHELAYAENAWTSGVRGMTMARVSASDKNPVEIYQQFYVPNFDKDNQPWLLLVYSKNITAVAEAQAISDERAELLASILSNNSVGLAHCDSGSFVFLNRIFQKYMRDSAEEYYLLDKTDVTFSNRILDYVETLTDEKHEPEIWDYYTKDGEHRLLKLEFTRRQTSHGTS
jgi:PAS domain-containing protein